MSLLVQKFGGTSVGSLERIARVAARVRRARERGDDVVVVVSAMSGETDRLLGLARSIQERPTPRELDVLLSTGEQVTIALLAMTLQESGCAARSYTGHQVRIGTDSAHTKARIVHVDDQRIRSDLAAGSVVVVAGFQGEDEDGNITTLGRGGSDTTAVALAAALGGRRVPDPHRCRWRLHHRSTSRARGKASRGAHIRRDAGAREPRSEGSADPIG